MGQAAEVGHSLAALKLGESQTYSNLTLFPLIGDGDSAPGYILLDEALDRHLVRVTEVSTGGSVPELALKNESEESVLLVDGDELIGAKQNRVLNLSILVAGGKRLTIPVSCVDRDVGRTRPQNSMPLSARSSLGRALAKPRVSPMRCARTASDWRTSPRSGRTSR